MPRSRTLTTAQILFAVCIGLNVSSSRAFSQQTSFTHSSNPFEDYFNALAAVQSTGVSGTEAAYDKLVDSLATMTPPEIAAGISVIDRQLDNTTEPQNPWAKPKAAVMLTFISCRPDGAELLASQMDRLASMLNDPTHLLSG
jgi:hypothetical protein